MLLKNMDYRTIYMRVTVNCICHLQANVNTMALENCIKDIKHGMIQNDLKLNTDKTVFLLFGTPHQLANTNISSFNAAGDIGKKIMPPISWCFIR